MFKVKSDKDFANLKIVLAKCAYEVNNREKFEKAENFDEEYLGNQFDGDYARGDVDMLEMDKVQDFDFKPNAGDKDQAKREEQLAFDRLISRLDESVIEEQSSSQRKTDKNGNFRYFDSDDEDPYYDESDKEEEEKKVSSSSKAGTNRTYTSNKDEVNKETLQA